LDALAVGSGDERFFARIWHDHPTWGQGDGAGGITPATAGTDYVIPSALEGFAPMNIPRTSISVSATLALVDAYCLLLVGAASAITLTVPADTTVAFPVGTQITITRTGAGTVTLAAAGGVTILSKDSKLAIDGQYAAVTLVKTGANAWYLWGALA